jgi:hypothetical protein
MPNEAKWIAIGAIGLFFALAAMMYAPDAIAERIAACMTQPGMQFTEAGCLPVPKEP